MAKRIRRASSWLTLGDLDGFFGLFLDNAIQLLLITVLCQQAVGLSLELVLGRILLSLGSPLAISYTLCGFFFLAMHPWSRFQGVRSHGE